VTRLFAAALAGAVVAHVVVENGAARGALAILLALACTLLLDGLILLVRLARQQLGAKGSDLWTRPPTAK
jgi:hypothetical protein